MALIKWKKVFLRLYYESSSLSISSPTLWASNTSSVFICTPSSIITPPPPPPLGNSEWGQRASRDPLLPLRATWRPCGRGMHLAWLPRSEGQIIMFERFTMLINSFPHHTTLAAMPGSKRPLAVTLFCLYVFFSLSLCFSFSFLLRSRLTCSPLPGWKHLTPEDKGVRFGVATVQRGLILFASPALSLPQKRHKQGIMKGIDFHLPCTTAQPISLLRSQPKPNPTQPSHPSAN